MTRAILYEMVGVCITDHDPSRSHPKRMMTTIALFLALFALVSAAATEAAGQIFQYTDKKGKVVFTDKPPQGSDAREKQLKDDGIFWSSPQEEPEPYRGGNNAANAPVPEPERKRRRDYGDVTVIMYMTDWCGYCKKTREYVRSLGAGLVEYNIERDPDRKDEMRKKGGSTGVPLIDIDGTIIRGYSPSAIKAALDRSSMR